MSKSGFSIAGLTAKRARLEENVTINSGGNSGNSNNNNGISSTDNNNLYLSKPIERPEHAIRNFLYQVRTEARNYLPKELQNTNGNNKIQRPFCEVEARLGIFKVLHSIPERRVTSTGTKQYVAYDCTNQPISVVSGVSRGMYIKTASAGISELSPISYSLGCTNYDKLKIDLKESELLETVYTGYNNNGRCCFSGIEHTIATNNTCIGKMESKEKLKQFDMTIPAANYDIRITLSSEKIMDHNIIGNPPNGWKTKRVKRRRSYTKRDQKIVWQIDITEVTTTTNANQTPTSSSSKPIVDYEIEMELKDTVLLQLINESNDTNAMKLSNDLAVQLWWILNQINPIHESLDVEEYIIDHPNKKAIALAQAQCGALKKFLSSVTSNSNSSNYTIPNFDYSPIGHTENDYPSSQLMNVPFIGCMPVNFSRHNIDEIQRSPDNAYYLSEKTDGVRYLMVFTGDTVVLLDRKMQGKQIKFDTSVLVSATTSATTAQPLATNPNSKSGTTTIDPMASILDLIQPGTVLDGEVVMNRSKTNRKPRPIYIVFDVLCVSVTQPILHLSFEQRKKHLLQATFRTKTATRNMFVETSNFNTNIDPLPLVRKNFVKRTELDNLLKHVTEERGLRSYCNGELYNHLTDGIIFQPNLPYVCGTDVNLLKWKYIDTVTIDVELLQQHQLNNHHNTNNSNSHDDTTLHVGCLGEDQTRVNMTRYIQLPVSERLRLEGDRFVTNNNNNNTLRIAEVGFHPDTGEWYYLKMRSDKVLPNHISTVLGTILELAESLTTDELRYRMSVPPGTRDTYRKELRGMLKGLLDHQRKRNNNSSNNK